MFQNQPRLLMCVRHFYSLKSNNWLFTANTNEVWTWWLNESGQNLGVQCVSCTSSNVLQTTIPNKIVEVLFGLLREIFTNILFDGFFNVLCLLLGKKVHVNLANNVNFMLNLFNNFNLLFNEMYVYVIQ